MPDTEDVVVSVVFFAEDSGSGPECWICYDTERTDAGPMINPCNCRGDVGAVHHDCLRRWLVEVIIVIVMLRRIL